MGADFKQLAIDRSVDKLSSKREGLLGNVLEEGYIPTIGREENIEKVLFETEVNQYTGVVESKKGSHIFFIEEKKEARQKDFEEVKELISGELRRTRMKEDFEGLVEQLKEQYHVKFYDDNLKVEEEETLEGIEGETPASIFGSDTPIELKFEPSLEEEDEKQGNLGVDGLFKLAGEMMENPGKALDLYNLILDEHPRAPERYKALFMVGFINAEHLDKTAEAAVAFKTLLEKYPDCDLADDAAFMLEEIEGNRVAQGDLKKNSLS